MLKFRDGWEPPSLTPSQELSLFVHARQQEGGGSQVRLPDQLITGSSCCLTSCVRPQPRVAPTFSPPRGDVAPEQDASQDPER